MNVDDSYFSMDGEKEEERVKIVLNVIATCLHMYVVPIVVLSWTPTEVVSFTSKSLQKAKIA